MKLLASILFLLFGIAPAFACTCINTVNMTDKEHSKYLKQVKAIFYGEVISLGEKRIIEIYRRGDMSVSTSYQPVKLKVLRSWKGIESDEVFVETDTESSCGYIASVGSKVMIYAYENKDTKIPLHINYCSIGHFDDEKMKLEYGAGKVFEHPEAKCIPQIENTEGFWAKLLKTVASFFP
jgi:hypothetical protein